MKKIFYLISTLGVSVVNFFEDEPKKPVAEKKEERVVKEKISEPLVKNEENFNFPLGEIVKNEKVEVAKSENILILPGAELKSEMVISPDTLVEVKTEKPEKIEKISMKESGIFEIAKKAKADSTDMGLSKEEMAKLNAEEAQQIEAESKVSRDIEISGLIMDQTRSKIGRDFYDSFFTIWNSESRPNEQYSITITENPVRGSVSQVSVFVNDTEIMRQFVQLRTSEIEEKAQQAVNRAHNYLLNQDDVQRQLLEEVDQMGSGLY